jgi:AAA+ ATPase superfamily predicted ATPase
VTFIDRENEIADLDDRWGMEPQVALLWGRRRVGKSTLLQRFAEGRPHVFYQAVKGTETEQLTGLTARILAYRADPVLAAAPLPNWQAALAYLLRLAREARQDGHPLLVIFDEFPYLVSTKPELPSLFQSALEDVKRENLPLFLVIAGSQITMFEQHVLHGPLYSRRTWGEQLPPLDYRNAGRFFDGWTPTDRLRAWAVLGGVPYYLEQFDPARSLGWNIENRLLRKGQVLYSEAELFVAEELGNESATYLSIISAVAGGATRQSEIASAVGIASTAAPPYLAQLQRLHVLEHLRPAGAEVGTRRGVWQLADGYLRFWFRFVRPNATDLEARRSAEVYRARVRPALDQFVSKPAFEQACREYAAALIGRDPAFPPTGKVGAWWGPVPDERHPGTRRTREGEIEVVVFDGRNLVLAGEAKWHDGEVDVDALRQLEASVVHVPGYSPATSLVVFARDGFTDRLRARASAEGVILHTSADMFD